LPGIHTHRRPCIIIAVCRTGAAPGTHCRRIAIRVDVDAVLAEAQAVGANVRIASTDLGALRAEVEASLRRLSQLTDELNRKWPFARDTEIKLP